MVQTSRIRRRRRWPAILIVLVLALAVLWAGGWVYGARIAQQTIDGWKAREAQSGRIYTCSNQTIGGFPFGIAVRCADAGAELKSSQPPLTLKAKDMLVTAHVWQPTVLTTDIVGPLTVSEPRQGMTISASWQHAETQVHGLPTAPQSVSIDVVQPAVSRVGGDSLFKADRLDLDGQLVSGSVEDNPVIQVVLKLVAAAAPSWHPAAAIPVNADITAVLRGLKNFAPMPWSERFRQLQAAGGRIEIRNARVQQRDTIAVASGSLGLSPAGRLDGQLNLTVANLEQLLPELHLDQMLSEQQASPKVNNTINALDRIMPGLGNLARKNAGPMIAASVNLMGQPSELEGQRAVTLPLRFEDGMVSLGPLKLGATPALY